LVNLLCFSMNLMLMKVQFEKDSPKIHTAVAAFVSAIAASICWE
jgi:hypothetical protein